MAEMKSAAIVEIGDAGGGHPHAPIGPGGALGVPFDMDEIVLEKIAGLAQRLLAAQESRAADGKDRVLEQARDVEARIVAGAEADRHIDLLALEIDSGD